MEMTADQGEMFDFAVVEQRGRKRSTLRQMLDAIEDQGPLCPQSFVGGFLGLSKSRISQFVKEGRLEVIEIGGRNFIPFANIDLFLTEERKNGRPVNLVSAAVSSRLQATETFSEFRK